MCIESSGNPHTDAPADKETRAEEDFEHAAMADVPADADTLAFRNLLQVTAADLLRDMGRRFHHLQRLVRVGICKAATKVRLLVVPSGLVVAVVSPGGDHLRLL